MNKSAINEYSAVVQTTDVMAAAMDGEIVMLHIESGRYFGFDAVGSRIWELMSELRQVSQLIAKLIEEYDVEPVQCQAETLEFLNHLYIAGLVRIV